VVKSEISVIVDEIRQEWLTTGIERKKCRKQHANVDHAVVKRYGWVIGQALKDQGLP
jgi:hypothetical protein